jgi:uncharacterized protein YggT (Ycf19 family)
MKRTSILPILAVTAAVIYIAFASAALIKYPLYYSPFANWLSDLGNPTMNPFGAAYYNIGGIVTSLVLVLFFGGMQVWNSGDRKMKVFLGLSQASGMCLAVAFMVTALYPLGVNNGIHSAFSIVLFVAIGCFEIFSASAIRKNPTHPSWLPAFGFMVAAINFMFGISFNFADLFVGEWVMIGLLIVYIITLALTQYRSIRAPQPKLEESSQDSK